ncbi:MAG: hypothetical protein FJ087_01730 [Deltaproteobacteria bacterium]|nr:hypothetical protein [Deltaproteobacteria bacterium]
MVARPVRKAVRNDTGATRDEQPAFSVKRARLHFTATLFGGRLQLNLQPGFDNAEPRLFDAFADARFLDGRLQVRLGQWRRPFVRSWMTSYKLLEFAMKAYGLSLSTAGYAWSVAEDHPFGSQDLQKVGFGGVERDRARRLAGARLCRRRGLPFGPRRAGRPRSLAIPARCRYQRRCAATKFRLARLP